MNYLKKIYHNAIPKDIRYNFKINVIYLIFTGAFVGCYFPFFGIIARDKYGASPFLLNLITSAQYLAGLTGFLMASFVPKGKEGIYSRNIHIISSLFFIGAAFATKASAFCVMLFLFHMAACFTPLDNMVYALIYPTDIRAKIYGYVKIFYTATSFIVTAVLGFIVSKDLYNVTLFNYNIEEINLWRLVFFMGGIFFIGQGIARAYFKTDITPEEDRQNPFTFIKKSFKDIISQKANIYIIISGIFLTTVITASATLTTMYYVDIFHFTGKEISLLTIIGSVVIIFVYPLLGVFFNKMTPMKAWLYIFLFSATTPLCFIFIGKSWYPLIIMPILATGFNVCLDLCWINLLSYLGGKDKILEYQAFYDFINGIRAVIGLFAATFLINYCDKLNYSHTINLKISFMVCIGLLFIGFLIALNLLRFCQK